MSAELTELVSKLLAEEKPLTHKPGAAGLCCYCVHPLKYGRCPVLLAVAVDLLQAQVREAVEGRDYYQDMTKRLVKVIRARSNQEVKQ